MLQAADCSFIAILIQCMKYTFFHLQRTFHSGVFFCQSKLKICYEIHVRTNFINFDCFWSLNLCEHIKIRSAKVLKPTYWLYSGRCIQKAQGSWGFIFFCIRTLKSFFLHSILHMEKPRFSISRDTIDTVHYKYKKNFNKSKILLKK